MSRIDKETREKMVATMLNHALQADSYALNKRSRDFADAVYYDVYSEDLRNKMKALPEGFVKKANRIVVYLGNGAHELFMSDVRRGKEDMHYTPQKRYDMQDPMTLQFGQLEFDKKEFKAKREALKAQVEAVIGSCSTFKKLWEVWPESHPILKDFDVAQTNYRVTVVPEQLNAACGLPVEQK